VRSKLKGTGRPGYDRRSPDVYITAHEPDTTLADAFSTGWGTTLSIQPDGESMRKTLPSQFVEENPGADAPRTGALRAHFLLAQLQ
jgi:hypothetical protein